MENESALLKWAVAGPVVSDISWKCWFCQWKESDKQAFTNVFEELGNPFLEEGDQLCSYQKKTISLWNSLWIDSRCKGKWEKAAWSICKGKTNWRKFVYL